MRHSIPSFPRYSDAEQQYGDYLEAFFEEHPDATEQDAADEWYAREESYWEGIAERMHAEGRL